MKKDNTKKDNTQRPGQIVFNTVFGLDPNFANTVCGTDTDCFYDDKKIEAFLAAWMKSLTAGMQSWQIPTKALAEESFGNPAIPVKSLAHEEAIKNLKVKVHAYRGILIIETVDPDNKDYPGWVPAGEGKIGCVLKDTKTSLGISHEAMEWLEKMKTSRDSIGDVDWWACSDGTYAFGWLGGVFSLKGPDSTGSRHFEIAKDHCVPIPNNPPKDAMEAVDRGLDGPDNG